MKYLNSVKIVFLLSLLSCDSFNKLSQNLADAQPSIFVITTKDKLNTNATPVVFKSPYSVNSTSVPVASFDNTQCILFKDLAGHYDVYYVDNKINPAKQNGESWLTPFKTINAAMEQVTQNRIKNQTNKPAIIAMAAGHYTHTKENVGNNEIISMYGLVNYLYNDTHFFGGYKNGDACVNVQKNPNFYTEVAKRTTILDGEKKNTVIAVAADVKDIVFSHLTIQNGLTKNANNKRDGGGISIRSNSKVLLNQIIIKDSQSHNNGGCLSIKNAKIAINNLILENCRAQNGHGGGLFLSNATDVDIYGLKVNNARAQQNGGAFYGDNSKINFGYFLLDNNKAQNGAGIYIKNINLLSIMTYVGDLRTSEYLAHNGVIMSIDKPFNIINELRDNTASQSGGGMYIDNTVKQAIDFERIKFINNKANNGAGFYALNKVFSIRLKNALFRDNKATQNGGAMYFNNGFDKFETLHDNVITDAKYNIGFSYTPIIIANHILNNSAGNQGGGIYVDSGLMNNTAYLFKEIGTDIPLIFDGNKANNGGAIALGNGAKLASARGVMIGGLYENNQANESGVIHFNQTEVGDNIKLWGDFNNNKALNGDGAITKITTSINEIIIIGNFVANSCSTNGVEHNCNGAAFNISNAQKISVHANISKHQVTRKGGFLYSKKTNNVLIQKFPNKSNLITLNLANNMGGVFYFNEISNNLEIDGKRTGGLSKLFLSIQQRLIGFRQDNGEFLQPKILQVSLNRANKGGFLYANKILGNVSVNDALFTRNSANYGGALFFNGIDGNLSVKESLFHENLATTYGGAMYVENVNNAVFDGLRDKTDLTVNRREYFDKTSFNTNKNWLPIADYLDNLNEFNNNTSKYANNSKNIFLAQNNVAGGSSGSVGGFVYFGTINNLALDHMPMGNNKPQAVSVSVLQGTIQGVNRASNEQITGYKDGYDDVTNIIYDDGRAIKDINVFFDTTVDDWVRKYPISHPDYGIVGHNGYMYDNSKSNYKTKTGIVIQNVQNKNVPSVR